MDRTKSSQLVLRMSSRAFGQEIHNLNDLIRIVKNVQHEGSKLKYLNTNLTQRTSIDQRVNQGSFRESKENIQNNKSLDRINKQKVQIHQDNSNIQNDINKINQQRAQSLNNQQNKQSSKEKNTKLSQQILKYINNPILDNKAPYIISNLSQPKWQENNLTLRFHDIKNVMIKLENKKQQEITNKIQAIDLEYDDQPNYISQYAQESHEYVLSLESRYMPNPLYFQIQSEINKKMRSILIDWLVDVQFKFKMRQETLFFTVNILDRFLSIQVVKRNELQLYGVGAMLIAAKYEEIYTPQLKDFSFITQNNYNREDIINAESNILQTLEFQLNSPITYHFLNRYQIVCCLQVKHFYLTLYVSELLAIQEPSQYMPSQIAAGAFYLVRKIKKYEPAWPKELQMSSQMEEQQVRFIAKYLCQILQTSQTKGTNCPNYFLSAQRKYSSAKFMKIGLLKIGKSHQPTHTTTMVQETQIYNPI